ncbi:hydroxysqualene dehydroxylase HpnE [Undibacterium flavidum]|uniref:FAD-dependent oxidoreductase n=1 Tax=Undibacterium flavidum TaxID=2762297 RepID=A0ABR6YDD2_9BURK|nr:hydroxysqualene dehydroxylase HpnE [Undibacterium flavidum]MBC3874561.1 FAD-dependent oxidoreductase [Undibacterium flavidum]
MSKSKHIAVVGAGWAGCAAAVKLSQNGHRVTLIEAARTLGGRARAVEIHGKRLDNGQHILLGAYTACLDLMRLLNIDQQQNFLRLPLQMVYPHQTGMQFIAPKLPAPLHLLFALWQAKGLAREDKLALARFSTTARWIDWQLNQDCSVSELLQRYDQTERLCRLMWNPLCIAALNTPPERASAQVFLNVLRDSLGARRAASDMLIPRQDLSSLLPNAAAEFVTRHAGQIILGTTIHQLTLLSNGKWCLPELSSALPQSASSDHLNQECEFDGLVVATNAEQCHKLLAQVQAEEEQTASPDLLKQLAFETQFDYEPITTCYLQYADSLQLDRPFYALADNPAQSHWAQFIFDRGQLNSQQAGLMAVVVSASTAAIADSHAQLTQAICQQLSQQLQMPHLAHPLWTQVITEKRATFSCKPDLQRPQNHTAIANLVIAGDYTACDYPATLEAAVRSGLLAAAALN